MTASVRSHVDTARRTAFVTTTFDHPVEVVWTLFSDPTKLARWWGPPGMPMVIDRHDLQPGGTVELTVSTPDAEIRGRWTIDEVAAPHRLGFTFASDGLSPTEIVIDLDAASEASTTMTITARFESDDTLRHAVDIGFVEGIVRSCTAAHDAIVPERHARMRPPGCEFSGVGVDGVDQQAALDRHRAIAARWRQKGIDPQLSRECVITIAETYVQNNLVDEREMDVLLNDDVVRWTQQNHAESPRDTSAETIRESTRSGAESTIEDITNRRWFVDGNEAVLIADIIVTGLEEPVTLYERFLIRWGQIAEIEAIFQSPTP